MDEAILISYCKASDYDASTGVCMAPFYGPASSFPPPLGVAEGLAVSGFIAGCWAIGFFIRQGRRLAEQT